MKGKRDIAILGYFHGPKLGVGVFMNRFVATLAKNPEQAARIVFYTNRNTLDSFSGSLDGIEVRTPWLLGAGSVAAIFWSAVVFPSICLVRGVGAALILTNPVVLFPVVRTVSVVHDLNEFEMEQKYGWLRTIYRQKIMMASTVAHSQRLVAISKFVERQIRRYFRQSDGGPIDIVPNGVDTGSPELSMIDVVLTRFDLEKDGYYLVVGRLDPRGKNLYATVDLYRRLEERYPGRRLIFVGGFNDSTRVEAEAFLGYLKDDPWLKSRARYLGFVDDTTLVSLYSAAAATIFFSRVEGFGFPMIEAFNLGCPVIINAACEVLCDHAEGAAIVADESRLTTGAALAIGELFDPDSRSRLRQKMSTVAAKYTWESCVEGYLNVLDEVMG